MRPYEMSDLTMDLIEFARYMLKPGGRLVFFLPTVTKDYSELDVPECDGMKMVGNSIQDFGKWARRVRIRTRYSRLMGFALTGGRCDVMVAHNNRKNDDRQHWGKGAGI